MRREAEGQLRESEARFREMADNAPVMVRMTEADGTCTYLSRSWYEFTGQTPETGLGFGWVEATHPDDGQRTHDAFVSADEQHADFRAEYRLRRGDGAYRWAIDSAKPRFGAGGEFLGYVGSVIDITERKRAEMLLDAQRQSLEMVVRGAPLAEVLDHPRAGNSPPPVEADGRLDWLRVLVVDDEPDTCELLRALLAGRGAKVTTASSADEAIAALEASRFDLLVSDIGMPGADGYELIRRVRALGPAGDIPAVALTAYARAEDRLRALRAGYQSHVAKPAEPSELIVVVSSLVRRGG